MFFLVLSVLVHNLRTAWKSGFARHWACYWFLFLVKKNMPPNLESILPRICWYLASAMKSWPFGIGVRSNNPDPISDVPTMTNGYENHWPQLGWSSNCWWQPDILQEKTHLGCIPNLVKSMGYINDQTPWKVVKPRPDFWLEPINSMFLIPTFDWYPLVNQHIPPWEVWKINRKIPSKKARSRCPAGNGWPWSFVASN